MSENEAVENASAADAPAAEEKPKRRTTRAKKTTTAASEATAEAAASSDATSDEPKPVRKTRTRKAAQTAEATDSEEKPPAKKRSRSKKSDVDEKLDVSADSEKDAVPSEMSANEEAKPAKRIRRGRSSKDSKPDESQEADVIAATEEPQADAVKAKAKEDADASENSQEAEAREAGSERRRPRRERHDREKTSDAKQESADSAGKSNTGSNNSNTSKGGKQDHNDRRNRRKRNQKQEVAPSVTLEELEELKVADLRARAEALELDVTGMKKSEMVVAVYAATMKAEGFVAVEGVLDILSDGYGFLRTQGYLPGEGDVYVGTSLIRRNGLRKGDYVRGTTRPTRENEKYAALQKVEFVNDIPIAELGERVKFADLTPVYPDERLLMEHGKNTITSRVIDLAAPIGKGQRGLIVSPPKAGKTTVLKDIAASITANNPEVHLMCLLVDERPEEVTDMQRSIKGEVVSSTFDMPCENHIAVAELVIERAKRLVELGRDVVILLDSLTRLARAYNLAQPASGRILSGGVDSTALYPPKRFLGAARNIEFGGSLTILASALVDTGSKMDEVIFEEFKGTGNMELKLDRNLADRRIFPAIDPITSGTRKEDLLLDPQEAPLIWAVRRILSNMNNTERAMDVLIKSLKQTDSNQVFLLRTAKKAQMTSGKIDEL